MTEQRACVNAVGEICHEHDRRIIILEKDMEVLQRDVKDHKVAMDQVVAVLNLIKDEITATKGFLKAMCIGAVMICTLVGAVYTVGWIQVPTKAPEIVSR